MKPSELDSTTDETIAVGHASPRTGSAASFQRSLLFQPTKSTPLLARSSGLSQKVVDVTVTTHDDLVLNGWLVIGTGRQSDPDPSIASALNQGRPLVIVFPGNAGNRATRQVLLSALCSAGADVLIFDYRGYGENQGDPAEAHLVQDARAIWNYANTNLKVPSQRIAIYGESLGGAVATRLASDLCAVGIEPRGLIVQSSFNSVVDTARHHFPILPVSLLSVDRFESERHIMRVTCPYLHIHGERDTVVPFALGQKLFEAAPEESSSGVRKQLLVLPNANHNDVYERDRDAVVGTIRDFVAAHQSLKHGKN